MLSAFAALLAAAGIGLWRGPSATARVAPPRAPLLIRVAALAQARLTKRRSLRRREREAVALVRALAGELRSGAPEPAAFAAAAGGASGSIAAGSLAAVLAPAVAAVARGASLPAELQRVAAMPGAGRLLPVAAAWTVASRHGSPMSGLLDRLAAAYDDEDAVRADLAASVAGSRASMLLLAALPLGGLALGGAIGAHPWRWLFGGPPGWAACVLAAALDAAGLAWTRWLLRGRP
ncbi:MAG: tight adherence protein [Frankiaceae bacterium]|jgi:tight adherence protein B|nr:tight adherence protein [Frankiaceae bacterium]